MRHRASLAAVMRACVNEDETAAIAAARRVEIDGLADLALEHGIAGVVYRHLGQVSDLDASERHRLGALVLQNRADHEAIARDLRHLAEVFEPLGSPWIVVKGPAVAATLYSPPDLRTAGDLDVLVAPQDFARAVGLLESAGHLVDDANWPLVRRLAAGQLHLMLPAGTPLDLHWHLLFNAEERSRFPMTTAELLGRRRNVVIADRALFTLDPVDTVIHLCFHAAKEGGDRLGWLEDIKRAAAVPGLDWDAVVARTEAWRMQLPVGTMLQRAAQQLGAPIPPTAVERLLPPGWRTITTVVDGRFPVAAMTRRTGNPASLLARSTTVASSQRGAALAAFTGLARRALQLARTGVVARIDYRHSQDSPANLHYRAAHGDVDRELYFTAVGSVAEEHPA